MHIVWEQFTPYSSLIGGILIGLASILLLWCLGRIAGITGIVAGLITPVRGDWSWRLVFVAGMFLSSFLYRIVAPLPAIRIDASWGELILAGFIVGIGTRLSNGCTSGHGVCGLARLSMRSLIATLTFMLTGFLTVFVLRHVF
ncbi:YeeE/YedE family protein [Undibacterium oligocarboniphilum]|uniref:YeeE/YedE family protein n=1 Tax=Undibacterium oligocarboniphilum TaxID=666702 RepID=A0A850QI57_9BURK|nr:YeeE/YedE family protein [Undibacterium oligocarboniphilum]MBC3869103.1 YeeE/YedE family protein [Undibacterium oligocarboniphilum]NVO77083.1 YeeE/YedE family protein [Undibacterium oligocarboniphilum]